MLLLALAMATLGLTAAETTATAAPTEATQVTTDNWVGSWSATPMTPLGPDNTLGMPLTFAAQTLRQIVRPHLSGETARVRLTNRYGTQPITFQDAKIAKQVAGIDNLPAGLGVPRSRPASTTSPANWSVPRLWPRRSRAPRSSLAAASR